MSTVSLARVPEIVQGAGALEALGGTLAGMLPKGGAVLLVVDPGLRTGGVVDAAVAALRAGDLDVVVYDDVKSDPTMAQVDAAALIARRERVTAVRVASEPVPEVVGTQTDRSRVAGNGCAHRP